MADKHGILKLLERKLPMKKKYLCCDIDERIKEAKKEMNEYKNNLTESIRNEFKKGVAVGDIIVKITSSYSMNFEFEKDIKDEIKQFKKAVERLELERTAIRRLVNKDYEQITQSIIVRGIVDDTLITVEKFLAFGWNK